MAKSKSMPAMSDQRGWAQHWGGEAVGAIRRAVADPHPTTIVDLDLEHAVRAARMAFYHAARAGDYRYWERNYVLALGKEL